MSVLLYIWQLPQNLLGLLLIHLFHCTKNLDYWVTSSKKMTGISLGRYVIVRKNMVRDIVVKHESGHQRQSLMLGPLYLILIGLPSIIGNIVHRMVGGGWYYKQPWERWADYLGGVRRYLTV